MKEIFEIEKITFGKKEVDRGVILGRRPWKWTLGRKYSPCHAKDLTNKVNVSALSPHKSNFFVYIPSAFLEVGQVLHIVNKEYQKERIEKTVKILTVTPQYIETERIESETPATQENTTQDNLEAYSWKVKAVSCHNYLADPEEIVFDSYVLTGEEVEEFEEVEEVEEVEEIHDKPQTQTEVFLMGKKQQGFTFIMETAPKSQETLFDVNSYTREPQREILTLTNPEIDIVPYKVDYQQFPMFTPKYERKERRNNIENLPILQAKEEKREETNETVKGFSPPEIAVLTALMYDKPKHIDDLHKETSMPIGILSATLLMLEMSNKITQKAGKMFLKC